MHPPFLAFIHLDPLPLSVHHRITQRQANLLSLFICALFLTAVLGASAINNSYSSHSSTNYPFPASLREATMTDELIDGVKQWTLEEMLDPQPSDPNKSKKQKALEWGFPGHLTQSELDIYVKFRDEVETQGGEFRNTVYSFTETEGEAYTLTRWLRARKYNLKDTIDMVTEATKCRADPRQYDYYPDPTSALGVDPSVFISQYPQLYTGFSKIGCPVFYSKPGVLNIDGIECITTLEGILKFHWHVMQHDYKQRLLEFKKENPSFCRFECVSVLDLADLTVSQLGARTLEVIKKQAFIDSLCFPETMNKMIIVNAPRFFSATWSIIKGFIDIRTANKIELFSSTSAAEKKLKEIIDVEMLPKDYGGNAESTKVLLAEQASKVDENGGKSRLLTEIMYIRSYQSFKIDLQSDEEIDIWIHTRSTSGASFKVLNARKVDIVPATDVVLRVSAGLEPTPCKVHLTPNGRISGADVSEIKVKGTSLVSRMTSDSFLLVANIYKK